MRTAFDQLALKILVNKLKCDMDDRREPLIADLRHYGQDAVMALLPLLKNPYFRIVERAIDALTALDALSQPAVIQALALLLDSPDLTMHRLALVPLADIALEEGVQAYDVLIAYGLQGEANQQLLSEAFDIVQMVQKG